MKNETPDIETLLAYLGSELSARETTALEKRLMVEEPLRRQLLELSIEESTLSGWAKTERTLIALDNKAFKDLETPTFPTKSFILKSPWLAAAAIFVALVGFATFVALDRKGNEPSALGVARLVASIDADWLSKAPLENEALPAGKYELAQGAIDLLFTDGARVSLSGPARFSLVSARHIHLDAGNLVAQIPDEALGFIVTSPQSEVVDLGTEFGLSVSHEEGTDVHVIDGLVEVLSRESGSGSRGVRIAEGQARRFHHHPDSAPTEIPVSSRASLLGKESHDRLGVQMLRGSVRIADHLGAQDYVATREGQNWIKLIAEKKDVTLSEPLVVTLDNPGSYREFTTTQILPPGSRVNSYLLHFRPSSKNQVRGVIRFDQPIVGVICLSSHLGKSDSIFGIPSVEYPTEPGPRGLEPGPHLDEYLAKPGTTHFEPDEVILSQDRSVLCINASANLEGGYDQVRIITLANPATE
ncbi:MAG: FecR family protein [Verrucomicrobiota bacterium]